MKRILAAVVAAALLLTGGCGRQRLASGEAKPAAVTSPAAEHTAAPAAEPVGTPKAAPAAHSSSTKSDAGALLGDVDKLLAGDSSPGADQD